MKPKSHTWPAIAAIVILLFLSSVQGARLDGLRKTESFYRWVLSASLQSRLGQTLELDRAPDRPEAMDDELFAKVLDLAEAGLPELPIEEDDLDDDGNPHHVLLRAALQDEEELAEGKLDKLIYDLVAGADALPLRTEFLQHLGDGLLESAGTQFDTAALYDKEMRVEGVGLTSLFFGFRKVAANFLWLQVDTFYHSGEMHRMLPLMRMSVALDPSFVDAYLLGAWQLAYNLTAKLPHTPEPMKEFHPKYKKRLGVREEWYYVAADFLKDGIDKNPRDYRLYFDLGYAIYENKLKDHPNAVLYLTEARRYQHDKWVPRMLYLAMWRNGQYEDAIEGWEGYLKDIDPGSDKAMRGIQINKGYLAEAKAAQADKCRAAAQAAHGRLAELADEARERGDLQQAGQHESEARIAEEAAAEMGALADTEWANAREIWTPMLEVSEDDSIAASRLHRQKAMRYVREGSYYEAVAELQLARYAMLQAFDEISDLMIEIKQTAGIPLTMSEQMAVERQGEAALYRTEDPPKQTRYIDCAYLDETGV